MRSRPRRQSPVDGDYVELWRLMLRYPELLAWEQLWHDSLRETYKAIYGKVKSVKPAFRSAGTSGTTTPSSPIYRAEQDLQQLAPCSDFLKVVIYHNVAGERMAQYIDNVASAEYGGVPQEELLDFHYRVLGYKGEKSYAEIPQTGFSSDYVLEETKRARAALNHAAHAAMARHRYRHAHRGRP